ncbi:MAG: radical SAM protein [Candidatus Wallbacteria bacterium]|nr:radical SAM protein [Candidatus Wallbacteria bacterium]
MDNLKLNYLLSPYLTIELTNACNLKCGMCTLRDKDPLSPRFMEETVFEKILSGIYGSQLTFSDLRLFWAGEPLLHPKFARFIQLLACREAENPKFKLITMDSNALLLSQETASLLVKHGKALKLCLILSLDSLNPETYQKIRKGGDCLTAIGNIRRLLDIKGSAEFPRIAVQMIVMRENFREVRDFIEYWKPEFEKHGQDFNLLVNSSVAEKNGVNLRPLTEQDRPALQDAANHLFTDTLINCGIVGSAAECSVFSQGGGRYDEK